MAGNIVQGAVFTVMVVRAGLLRDPAFEAELAEQIRRSPRFFLNAPVVLDLRDAAEFHCQRPSSTDAKAAAPPHADAWSACRMPRRRRSRPRPRPGWRALRQIRHSRAVSFPPNNRRRARRRPQPARAEAAAKTLLVTQLVRSGTQIYARGADLVVTAAVSPGAEIMADGNIHVYGAVARQGARRRLRRRRGANLLQPVRGRARQHRRAVSGQRANAAGRARFEGADSTCR